MKMGPNEAYKTVKCAIAQLERISKSVSQESDIPEDIRSLYICTLTALGNMGSAAECVIENCNKIKQILENIERARSTNE